MNTIIGKLENNKNWPFKLVGILEIIDTSFKQDCEFPSWCIGAIMTENEEDDMGIEICNSNILMKNNIDIDSDETVNIYIEQAEHEDECSFSKVTIDKNVYKIVNIEAN